MGESFLDGRVVLHPGNCLDVLAQLEDCSIDSCVTDPPYLLTSIVNRFGADGATPAQYGQDGRYKRLSGGFMNKRWDAPGDSHGLSVFEAWLAGFIAGEGCFRIQAHKNDRYYTCQFGIHLRQDDAPILLACQKRVGGRIVFGDARENKQGIKSAPDIRWLVETQESCLALANILDRIPLFAKKAADYALWRRGLDLWINTPRGSRWHGARDVSEMAALHRELQVVKRWDGTEVDLNFDPFMPPAQAFHYHWAKEVYRVLKPGGHLISFGGCRTYHRMASAIEDAGFEIRQMLSWIFGSGFPKSHSMRHIGRPELGTDLKPAHEPICLARKPLSEGTVAANVLRWGTGAINVDGCRVGTERREYKGGMGRFNEAAQAHGFRPYVNGVPSQSDETFVAEGRWPANVCTDGSDEVTAAFPETTSGFKNGGQYGRESGVHDGGQRMDGAACYADAGSAARFFYTAKADADDRLGSKHPTVKPLDLMQWLVRMVTPPGGTVLDPFAGTGTTGEAAWREGMRAVLIEAEPEYQADIRRRMALVLAGPDERSRESIKAKNLPVDYGPLFGFPEAAE